LVDSLDVAAEDVEGIARFAHMGGSFLTSPSNVVSQGLNNHSDDNIFIEPIRMREQVESTGDLIREIEVVSGHMFLRRVIG
jgi:hypothetical protein